MICCWLDKLYFENKAFLAILGTMIDHWTKQQLIIAFWNSKKFKSRANDQWLENQ